MNVGTEEEVLKIFWTNPDGSAGLQDFLVGTECFLENPVSISQVPDAQLLAAVSMAVILEGSPIPGSPRFFRVLSELTFPSIVGPLLLRANAEAVTAPKEALKDLLSCIEMASVQNPADTKLIEADLWELSQYSHRLSSGAHAVQAIPAALHENLGLRKSELGEEDSVNRQAVLGYISATRFWV